MSREVTQPRRSRSEGPVHSRGVTAAPAQPAPASSYQSGASSVIMSPLLTCYVLNDIITDLLTDKFRQKMVIMWPMYVRASAGHCSTGDIVTGPLCRVQTAVCPRSCPGRSPEQETSAGVTRAGGAQTVTRHQYLHWAGNALVILNLFGIYFA